MRSDAHADYVRSFARHLADAGIRSAVVMTSRTFNVTDDGTFTSMRDSSIEAHVTDHDVADARSAINTSGVPASVIINDPGHLTAPEGTTVDGPVPAPDPDPVALLAEAAAAGVPEAHDLTLTFWFDCYIDDNGDLVSVTTRQAALRWMDGPTLAAVSARLVSPDWQLRRILSAPVAARVAVDCWRRPGPRPVWAPSTSEVPAPDPYWDAVAAVLATLARDDGSSVNVILDRCGLDGLRALVSQLPGAESCA